MACPMCILTRYVFGLVAISGLISMIIKEILWLCFNNYFIHHRFASYIKTEFIFRTCPEQIDQLAGGCSRPFHVSVEYDGIIKAIKQTLEGGPSCAEDGMRFLFNFAEWGLFFFFIYFIAAVLKIRSSLNTCIM